MTTPEKMPSIPVNELQSFVNEQMVVLEGENTLSEEERKTNSRVINGMETSYLAGKMAMLKAINEYVEELADS